MTSCIMYIQCKQYQIHEARDSIIKMVKDQHTLIEQPVNYSHNTLIEQSDNHSSYTLIEQSSKKSFADFLLLTVAIETCTHTVCDQHYKISNFLA